MTAVAALDRRLHAYRDDLADLRLKDRIAAARYVAGEPAEVIVPVAPLLRAPAPEALRDSEALFGEGVSVFERTGAWAWAQLSDGYVGWLPAAALAAPSRPATHRVIAPRTFVFTAPDLKRPVRMTLSLGSLLRIEGEAVTRGTRYLILAEGSAVFAGHVAPISLHSGDFVAIAERLAETPYLWGGRSAFGVDCSGLVQLCLAEAGITALRDSDMQATTLGDRVPDEVAAPLRRGDLVFWPGHVGIMRDGERLIHANAHAMIVSTERLDGAVARIAASGVSVSSVRRLVPRR